MKVEFADPDLDRLETDLSFTMGRSVAIVRAYRTIEYPMASRRPAEVFPPGEYLREELAARGWTQADLADVLGRSPQLVNEIIAGKRGISPETARGLAEALGTSPELWMNLDAAYQLAVVHGDDSGTG